MHRQNSGSSGASASPRGSPLVRAHSSGLFRQQRYSALSSPRQLSSPRLSSARYAQRRNANTSGLSSGAATPSGGNGAAKPAGFPTVPTALAPAASPEGVPLVNESGATLPEWLVTLPCCVRHAAMFAYGDLLRSGEDGPTRTRKMLATVCLLLGILTTPFFISSVLQAGVHSVARALDTLAALASLVSYFCTFAYVRKTGRAPPLLVDAYMAVAVFRELLQCGVEHALPRPALSIFQMTIAVFGRSARPGTWMLILALEALVGAYNQSVYVRDPNNTEYPLLALDGVTVGDFGDHFAGWLYIVLVSVGLLWVMNAQLRAGDAALQQANATAIVANELVARLAKYDTDGASEYLNAGSDVPICPSSPRPVGLTASNSHATLHTTSTGRGDPTLAESEEDENDPDVIAARERAEAEAAMRRETVASADQQLLRHFAALVRNLDRYRPHLPNWMLQEARHSDLEDDDGADEDLDLDLNVVTSSRRGSNSTPRTVQRRSGSGTPGNRELAGGRGSDRRSSKHSNASSNPSIATRFRSGNANGNVAGKHGRQRVVLATLHFHINATAASATAEAMDLLVDHVHDIAGGTAAGVHSFVGDVLFASWNAAAPAAQPEAKALRFLARLRAISADAPWKVAGAAMGGRAFVHVAGARSRQQALTLSAEWLPGLALATELARASGVIMVEHRFSDEASFVAETLPAVGIAYTPASASQQNGKWGLTASGVTPKKNDNDNDNDDAQKQQQRAQMQQHGWALNLSPRCEELDIVDGGSVATPKTRAAFDIVLGERDDHAASGEWMYVLQASQAQGDGESENDATDARGALRAARKLAGDVLQRWTAGVPSGALRGDATRVRTLAAKAPVEDVRAKPTEAAAMKSFALLSPGESFTLS